MSITECEHEWAEAFQHEALFYAGLDDFLAGTVPFVREGLENDEPTLVAVPRVRLQALESELGADASAVTLLDMEQIGRNPAHIIPAWRTFLAENGNGESPVRGIGEPIWAGRSDSELIECQRHEALLNVAFADSGTWRLLCPYDTAALPDDVIVEARRSHPWVSDATARSSSADCRALDLMAAPFDAPLPPPPADAVELPFTLESIPGVRHVVAVAARAAGFDQGDVDDVVLAAHELATNSVRHGGGRGVARVWRDATGLVCEVADRGRIGDPLVGRERPKSTRPGGRGLWMANQLCDLVQVRTFADGNAVRLHMRLR